MDCARLPPKSWFLCMCCVAHVFNHVSNPLQDHCQLIFLATGHVADISPLLQFSQLEPVHHKVDNSSFPLDLTEALGHWIGVAEHVGHTMTSKVWCESTNKVLDRSVLCPALLPDVHK